MNCPRSANSTTAGRISRVTRSSRPRKAPASRMFSRPGELDVEAGAQRQQAGHVALDVDHPLRRPDDPGQDLEQRALAGPVRTDDGQRLAVDDAERDVAQRPERLAALAREELAERPLDRVLAAEPKAVLDAEVLGHDGVAGRGDRRRAVFGRPSCLQHLREVRLEPLEDHGRDRRAGSTLATSSAASAAKSGRLGGVVGVP